jgi:hypothetical protein
VNQASPSSSWPCVHATSDVAQRATRAVPR